MGTGSAASQPGPLGVCFPGTSPCERPSRTRAEKARKPVGRRRESWQQLRSPLLPSALPPGAAGNYLLKRRLPLIYLR